MYHSFDPTQMAFLAGIAITFLFQYWKAQKAASLSGDYGTVRFHMATFAVFGGVLFAPVLQEGGGLLGLTQRFHDILALVIGTVLLWKGAMGKGGLFAKHDKDETGGGVTNVVFLVLGTGFLIAAAADIISDGRISNAVFNLLVSELE